MTSEKDWTHKSGVSYLDKPDYYLSDHIKILWDVYGTRSYNESMDKCCDLVWSLTPRSGNIVFCSAMSKDVRDTWQFIISINVIYSLVFALSSSEVDTGLLCLSKCAPFCHVSKDKINLNNTRQKTYSIRERMTETNLIKKRVILSRNVRDESKVP